jgi:hypothetical protein
MSLEYDVTEIKESVELREMMLAEGFARAKELYVDTKKMPLMVLKRLASKDPTEQKKYIEWMARVYLTQRSSRGFEAIAKFDDLCNRGKIQQKDINQYRTLEDVDDAISQVFAKEETSKKSKEQEFRETVKIDTEVLKMIDKTPNEVNPDGSRGDLFFENDKIVIACPSSQAKSELYGRNPDPACRGDKPSYWCTATPGQRYFDSYWGSQGNVLYYILPKTPDAVLYDPEPGHADRFSKVAIRIQSDGGVAEIRDRFNILVPDDKWAQLCRLWGISPKVSKSTK